MYNTHTDSNVEMFSIIHAEKIAENTAIYVFIGADSEDDNWPQIYIAIIRRDADGFLLMTEFSAMDYITFLNGSFRHTFCNDYVSISVEKKDESLCKITIIDASKIFEGTFINHTAEGTLPNTSWTGVCPF